MYYQFLLSEVSCEGCGWSGTGEDITCGEMFEELFEYHCPSCGRRLGHCNFPAVGEARANWDIVSEKERKKVIDVENMRASYEARLLKTADQLPDIDSESIYVVWDIEGGEISDDGSRAEMCTVLRHEDQVLWREPATWEGADGRFGEVSKILEEKYGERLHSMMPTSDSEMYLYGDHLRAPAVGWVRASREPPLAAGSTPDRAPRIAATLTLSGIRKLPAQLFGELASLLHAIALETPKYASALSQLAAPFESAADGVGGDEADRGASASNDVAPSGGDVVVVAKTTMNICDSPEIMAICRGDVADIIRELAFEQVDLNLAQVLHTVVQRFEEAGPTTIEESETLPTPTTADNSELPLSRTWRVTGRSKDLRLSARMRATLRKAVEVGRIEGANRSTLKALASRGLCGPDGKLNLFGSATAVSLLPLTKQCRVLDLPLDDTVLHWEGRPAPAALDLLLGDGDWGFADEGRTLHALIHALVLPRLYFMTGAWGNESNRRHLYASYAGHTDVLDKATDLRAGMLEDIRRWDMDAFGRSWVMLGEWNVDNTWLPHPATRVSVDLALATLEAVGEKRLSSIAERVFAEPYAYYRGWPDLMVLHRDGGLRFVEVKTTGRLYFGQIVTMSDMREAASLDMRVLRVRRDS